MVIEKTEYANSVFEQPWWLDIVAKGKWKEVFVKQDGIVVGRMVFVRDKKRICMPQNTQTLGPWLDNSLLVKAKGNTQLSKQKEVINKLFDQIPNNKGVDIVLDSSNEYVLPYRWMGYNYRPYFSYRINDLTDLDRIYSNFNKTVLKNIKSAQKKVRIRMGSDSEAILNLLDKTFAKQGRKVPGEKKIKKDIINKSCLYEHGITIIAEDEYGNVHSGAFLVFDEKVCYYLFGGTDSEFRSSGAQSLVLWKAIQYAAIVSKAFDFEGSNVEGIENFFRQFGGDRVINYRLTKNSLKDDLKEIMVPRVKRILGYKI